jgi:myo-inositol-1(or 4)-monophosphatase
MFREHGLNGDRLLTSAIDAATAAAKLLYEPFSSRQTIDVETKSDGLHNLVTEMDVKAENFLREALAVEADIVFLGEESGGNRDLARPTWVVDPLDGTVNYAHGIPIWCVSVALVIENRPVIGVIVNPNLDELFWAVSGRGAYLNDRRMSVSKVHDLRDSLLVTGFPYNAHENPHNALDLFVGVLRNGNAVRRLGSAALDLAYVADGRFEGFWEVQLNPWDVAAGVLLVEEAGGIVQSYGRTTALERSDNPSPLVTDQILATNRHINSELLRLLRGLN